MCEFCDDKVNITNLECATGKRVYYCPFCGKALVKSNQYFIDLNDEAYWLVNIDELSDLNTMSYVLSHVSPDDLDAGVRVYRAVEIGTIQGCPQFVES